MIFPHYTTPERPASTAIQCVITALYKISIHPWVCSMELYGFCGNRHQSSTFSGFYPFRTDFIHNWMIWFHWIFSPGFFTISLHPVPDGVTGLGLGANTTKRVYVCSYSNYLPYFFSNANDSGSPRAPESLAFCENRGCREIAEAPGYFRVFLSSRNRSFPSGRWRRP